MSTVDELAAAARRRFPEVGATGFAEHLAGCVADGAGPEHVADVLLAFAAARGDTAAVRHVDAIAAELGPAVRRIDPATDFLDEVRQRVRIRVLVADGDAPPRIAAYRGRGSLASWIRVVAVRVALDLKRGAARAPTVEVGDDVVGDLIGTEPDPELAHLKTLYRTEFRDALADALAALPDRQRAILRLHFVDGVRLAEIGRLYAVHESTVSRWVAQAADAAIEATRRRLTDRLSLSRSNLDSVARLVRSQLDLSIARLLR